DRGGIGYEFFDRIYSSNITGLDSTGKPVHSSSLKTLNLNNGADSASYSFDRYNLAMWGSYDDSGKYVSAYVGPLQTAYDLRSYYPIPDRQSSLDDWSTIDTDEAKWREWIDLYKLGVGAQGFVDDDAAHKACRTTAYTPSTSPCKALYTIYSPNNEGTSGF